MRTISIRSLHLSLEASTWNPRYRAGILYCISELRERRAEADSTEFTYEGETLWLESDMWDIARVLVFMGPEERRALGWADAVESDRAA